MTTKLRSACDNCHQTKVRCSGHLPCQGCLNSRSLCFYSFSNPLGRPRGTKNKRNWAESNANNSQSSIALEETRTAKVTTSQRSLAEESLQYQAVQGLRNRTGSDEDCNGSGRRWDAIVAETIADCESNVSRVNLPFNLDDDDPNNLGVSEATGSDGRDNCFVAPNDQNPMATANPNCNLFNKNWFQISPEALEFQSFTSKGHSKTQDCNFTSLLQDVDSENDSVPNCSKVPTNTPTSTLLQLGAAPRLSPKACSCLQQHAELLSNPRLSLASIGPDHGMLPIDKVLGLAEEGMKAWRSLVACTSCPYSDDQEVMLLAFMSIRAITRHLQRLSPCYSTTTTPMAEAPCISQSSKEESILRIGSYEVTGDDRMLVLRLLFQNTLQKVKFILNSLQEVQDKKKKLLLDETSKRTVGIEDYQASNYLFHTQQISYYLVTSLQTIESSLNSK